MALLRYLKRKDGLPDPNGSLSSTISSQAIASANHEVEEAMKNERKQRGSYNRSVMFYYNIYKIIYIYLYLFIYLVY